MLYNTEGIVIRSIAYGETHAIVTLLTPMGTVAALARGAKKPQSRLAAGVALCAEGLYSIYQRSGMGTIQQVELQNTHRVLHQHLDLAAYAAYFCELVGCVAEERPNGSRAVYDLFRGVLGRLQSTPEDGSIIARIWETKILWLLGSSPNWLQCVRCMHSLTNQYVYSPVDGGFVCSVCIDGSGDNRQHAGIRVAPGAAKVLDAFQRVPFERLGKVNLSAATLTSIKSVLSIQLTEYAGLSLKSRNVLESLKLTDE